MHANAYIKGCLCNQFQNPTLMCITKKESKMKGNCSENVDIEYKEMFGISTKKVVRIHLY